MIINKLLLQFSLHHSSEMTKISFDKFGIKIAARKCAIVYVTCEMCVWAFLAYSAIYHGKIFDYRHTDPADFEKSIDSNWYYRIMFGHLNLSATDANNQQTIQGINCDLTTRR